DSRLTADPTETAQLSAPARGHRRARPDFADPESRAESFVQEWAVPRRRLKPRTKTSSGSWLQTTRRDWPPAGSTQPGQAYSALHGRDREDACTNTQQTSARRAKPESLPWSAPHNRGSGESHKRLRGHCLTPAGADSTE